MRTYGFILFVLLSSWTAVIVRASCLITKDGKTYYDVMVSKNGCSMDSVTILHRNGIAKVACTNMYDFDKIKFGNGMGKTNVTKNLTKTLAHRP